MTWRFIVIQNDVRCWEHYGALNIQNPDSRALTQMNDETPFDEPSQETPAWKNNTRQRQEDNRGYKYTGLWLTGVMLINETISNYGKQRNMN